MTTPCAKSLGGLEVGAQAGAQDAWRRADDEITHSLSLPEGLLREKREKVGFIEKTAWRQRRSG